MSAAIAGARKTGLGVLLAAALAVLAAGRALPASGEAADDYRVIVHPASPVRTVSRAFLRGAYLKKATAWPDGETVRTVDLTRRFPARHRFAREVLNKTASQLRAYWNQQIFSGKGVPPPEVDSEQAMIAFVARHRGAVGYLPASADPEGVVVVTVK
jgi:hypothetical protein